MSYAVFRVKRALLERAVTRLGGYVHNGRLLFSDDDNLIVRASRYPLSCKAWYEMPVQVIARREYEAPIVCLHCLKHALDEYRKHNFEQLVVNVLPNRTHSLILEAHWPDNRLEAAFHRDKKSGVHHLVYLGTDK